MRKRLFRGKTIGDETEPGEWVCGDLETLHDGQIRITCLVNQDSGGTLLFSIRVIPETVGEFTGLVDSNGVNIFEGDIIHFEEQENYDWAEETKDDGEDAIRHKWVTGAIEWQGDDGIPGYDIRPRFDCEWNRLQELFHVGSYSVEVIGNIHDNPELLEGAGYEHKT